jgi:8-oxo-dGTP pyrophosphatase MutT (NUDIX family)
MKKWFGSAAICFNEKNEVLMVRSGGNERWAIPSGGIEKGESPEDCCIREVKEETGYDVSIVKKLTVKETVIKGIEVKTHYFKAEKLGENAGINDPDDTIVEAAWIALSDLKDLMHMYPEDVGTIIGCSK